MSVLAATSVDVAVVSVLDGRWEQVDGLAGRVLAAANVPVAGRLIVGATAGNERSGALCRLHDATFLSEACRLTVQADDHLLVRVFGDVVEAATGHRDHQYLYSNRPFTDVGSVLYFARRGHGGRRRFRWSINLNHAAWLMNTYGLGPLRASQIVVAANLAAEAVHEACELVVQDTADGRVCDDVLYPHHYNFAYTWAFQYETTIAGVPVVLPVAVHHN